MLLIQPRTAFPFLKNKVLQMINLKCSYIAEEKYVSSAEFQKKPILPYMHTLPVSGMVFVAYQFILMQRSNTRRGPGSFIASLDYHYLQITWLNQNL